MNAMYKLPANGITRQRAESLNQIQSNLAWLGDEVHEIDKIVPLAQNGGDPVDITVSIADLMGDITAYCRSEALKYGLPLKEVLDVNNSNECKLDENGNPIYDLNGKFLKG